MTSSSGGCISQYKTELTGGIAYLSSPDNAVHQRSSNLEHLHRKTTGHPEPEEILRFATLTCTPIALRNTAHRPEPQRVRNGPSVVQHREMHRRRRDHRIAAAARGWRRTGLVLRNFCHNHASCRAACHASEEAWHGVEAAGGKEGGGLRAMGSSSCFVPVPG